MQEENIINLVLANKEIPGKVTKRIDNGSLFIKPLIRKIPLSDGTLVRQFFAPGRYTNNINEGDIIAFTWDDPGQRPSNMNRGEARDPIAKNIRVVSEEDSQRLIDEILNLVSINQKESLLALQQYHKEILEEQKRELEQEYVFQQNDLIKKSHSLDLDRQKLEIKFNNIAQAELEISNKKDEIDNERKSIQVEQKESIKLRQEISRYTALLPLVRDNNSDSIASVIPGSIPETTDLQPGNLGNNWHGILTSRGLILHESITISYLICMISSLCSGSIVLLNGTVGVGKSSIIEKSAQALGGKAKIIPVRPSWLDPSDLLGFFDPLAETFRPSSFTSAIKEANIVQDRLFIICLDELNLARIENYGADLLSTLEYSKNINEDEDKNRNLSLYSQDIETDLWRKLELLSKIENPSIEQQLSISKLQRVLSHMNSECKIPQNLVLIGTLNSDETTYELSPKVIDRSYAITYPPANFNLDKPFSSEGEIYGEQLSVTLLQNKIDLCVKGMKKSIQSEERLWDKDWDQIVMWNEKYLSKLGIPVGYRVKRDYLTFFAVSYSLGITENTPNRCLAYFLFTKLLPRITFLKDGTCETLCQEWIAEIRRDYSMGGESYILEEIESQILNSSRRNVRYWG